LSTTPIMKTRWSTGVRPCRRMLGCERKLLRHQPSDDVSFGHHLFGAPPTAWWLRGGTEAQTRRQTPALAARCSSEVSPQGGLVEHRCRKKKRMRVPTIDAALPARRVGPRRSSKCVAKKAANKCRDASARDPIVIAGPRNNELLRNLWRAEAGLLERNPADSDGRDAPPPWRGRALRDTRPDRRSACPCLGADRGVGRVFPLLGDWGVPPARTHVQMRESRQGGKRGSAGPASVGWGSVAVPTCAKGRRRGRTPLRECSARLYRVCVRM